jgi:hypothetical protein
MKKCAVFAIVAYVGMAQAGTGTYRTSEDIDLPPDSQRTTIGKWIDDNGKCVRSIEEVSKKYYDVLRCSDGSGGSTGRRLTSSDRKKFVHSPATAAGDFYKIEVGGELGEYDREGAIDKLPVAQTSRP